MKFTIEQQAFLNAVNQVKSVVSSKSALPILSHVLIEADNNSIHLSATDLKVGIECQVDCNVASQGSATVACQRLSSILSQLPNKDVTIELGENSIVDIKCGKIETKLFTMAPEEFPPIRSFEDIEPIVLEQSLLKKVFGKTSFAICTDQARHNLTGLLFELAGGKLAVVATDGRRMSMCSEKEDIPDGLDFKVIIPGKMIVELERLLSDDGDVRVYIDETQAGFAFRNTRLVSALIDGTFPNYEMVIPKKHDREAVLDTAVFLDAVRRTRTMTSEKFNSVRFGLSKNTMSLKVVTPEVGEYHEDIEAEFDGTPLEIAFNPDFVLEVLKHIETEKTCLILKDGMSPGLLKPYRETSGDQYMNVIMPIRI